MISSILTLCIHIYQHWLTRGISYNIYRYHLKSNESRTNNTQRLRQWTNLTTLTMHLSHNTPSTIEMYTFCSECCIWWCMERVHCGIWEIGLHKQLPYDQSYHIVRTHNTSADTGLALKFNSGPVRQKQELWSWVSNYTQWNSTMGCNYLSML